MPISRSKKVPSIIASSIASIGLWGCGYAAGYPSPVIPMLMEPSSSIQLNDSQIMWFGALNSLGYLVAIPFGLASQSYFGRKRAMLINITLSVFSWLLIGCANGTAMLLAGRLMTGIASGLVYQTVPTYVSEIASASVRGALISMMGFTYLIGRISVLSVCYVISWRMMAFLGALVSVINFIGMCFMPETPRWLLRNDKTEEGKAALKWLRGDTNRFQRELRQVTEDIQKANKKVSLKKTITDAAFYKPMILIIFIQTMVALSCDGPMYSYSELILDQAGFPFARLGVVIIAVIQFFVCIVTNLNVEKYGRKILLTISAVGTSLSLFCFGVHVYCADNNIYPSPTPHLPANSSGVNNSLSLLSQSESMHFSQLDQFYFTQSDATIFPTNSTTPAAFAQQPLQWPYDFIPFLLLCVYFIFHAVGALNVNHLMCAELTSVEFTGIAAGCSVFVCYAETFYSTLSFLQLQIWLGDSGIYFIYASAQMFFIVVFMTLVPETGGDSRNIQLIWKGEIKLPLCNWSGVKNANGETAPLLSYSESIMQQRSLEPIQERGPQNHPSSSKFTSTLPTIPSNQALKSQPYQENSYNFG